MNQFLRLVQNSLIVTKTRFQKQNFMDKNNLYTPQELVNEFPQLAEHGWTSTKLGILFNMGILKGRRVNKTALITLESLKKLVEFRNSNNNIELNI